MKNHAPFAALAFLCLLLVGCSMSKLPPPSPEEVRATLDKVIKKDNPDASYSITSTDVHSTGTLVTVKISFEKFKFRAGDGKERDFSAGKATATFDLKNARWILKTLQTSEPENVLLLPELPVD